MHEENALSTDEELFCTKYELATLAGIVTDNRLERWVPGFCGRHTHEEHQARYRWAAGLLKNKRVLDIACGSGYGALMLANAGATHVTGWDIDPQTVRYASLRNRHPKTSYAVNDAESFKTEELFDAIVSFETIEHLSNPGKFLDCIYSALADGGSFLVSTPISQLAVNNKPDNIYHFREWGFRAFQGLVKEHLAVRNVYLQLYRGQPQTTGFLARMTQRTHGKRNDDDAIIEFPEPRLWDPAVIDEKLIGTTWTGYQILECGKKSDA